MVPHGTGQWLFAIAAFLTALASIIVSLTVIWSKFAGPYLAKPIAKAIKHELHEAIEVVFVDSDVVQLHIKEVTQEVIARETRVLLQQMTDHARRLERIEGQTKFISDRMAERPPRFRDDRLD